MSTDVSGTRHKFHFWRSPRLTVVNTTSRRQCQSRINTADIREKSITSIYLIFNQYLYDIDIFNIFIHLNNFSEFNRRPFLSNVYFLNIVFRRIVSDKLSCTRVHGGGGAVGRSLRFQIEAVGRARAIMYNPTHSHRLSKSAKFDTTTILYGKYYTNNIIRQKRWLQN